MSKIILTIGRREKIVNVADVPMFAASQKCVVTHIDGREWFVKSNEWKQASLKALYALGEGSHIYANRSAIIAVSAITGLIKDYEKPGHYGAVMRDGSIVKISRREASEFNAVYRGLIKNNS